MISREELLRVMALSKKEWQKLRLKLVTSVPPFDLEMRTRNLLDAKDILDKIGLKFWLTNGTALAAYRDGSWIPWDDDVDLDVYAEDFLPVFDQIGAAFIDCGFYVRATKKLKKMATFRGGEKLALRGLFLDPNYKGNQYRLRKRYKYLRSFYETPGTVEFQGETFNIPSPPKEFMLYVYGEEWEIPNKSTNEKVYSTKRIIRKGR